MANGVLMPKAGISVESCIITEWLKKPGDTVAVGDILFSYETDKASFECESTEAGTLLDIFFGDGDEVPVLINVCAVGTPGDDVAPLRPAGGADSVPAAPAPKEEAAPTVAPAATTPVTGETKASPRARNLATKERVDLRLAGGTGPYGRIIERDIQALIASGAGATSAAFGAVEGSAPDTYTGTGIGGRIRVSDLAAAVPASVSTFAEFEDVKSLVFAEQFPPV